MQGHCTGQCFMKCSLLHTKRIMFPSLDIWQWHQSHIIGNFLQRNLAQNRKNRHPRSTLMVNISQLTVQRVSSSQEGYKVTEVDLPFTLSCNKYLDTYGDWISSAEVT
jgi:hypothetical protein